LEWLRRLSGFIPCLKVVAFDNLANSSNAQHQAFWNCQVPNIRDGCMNSGWRLKLGAAKLISVPALPGANNFNKEEPFSRSVVS
jgi:hypothetical protein